MKRGLPALRTPEKPPGWSCPIDTVEHSAAGGQALVATVVMWWPTRAYPVFAQRIGQARRHRFDLPALHDGRGIMMMMFRAWAAANSK